MWSHCSHPELCAAPAYAGNSSTETLTGKFRNLGAMAEMALQFISSCGQHSLGCSTEGARCPCAKGGCPLPLWMGTRKASIFLYSPPTDLYLYKIRQAVAPATIA